jgi:dipeptidyl aminopeptidase/acylaminoacyl peptidase
MANDSHRTLKRISLRVPVPEPAFERLLSRRDRRERNRRISAAVLAIIVTVLSVVGLMRAFGNVERPATEPTPKPPGIFSEVGGWIAYGGDGGIWAVDPTRPDDPNSQIQLSTETGTPLAWSSDGSKLLILRLASKPQTPSRLFVLNADGTETYLTTIDTPGFHGGFLSGGSFSPDGSQVVYSERSSIYVVNAQGGKPRILFNTNRRWSRSCGCFFPHPWTFNPTYSPDGTQIAYADGIGDNSHQVRVMNADGSGSRVLVDEQQGHITNNLAWSPDGTRLAFGLGTGSGIYVVNADSSGLTLVIRDGTWPYWSPDGSRISYQPCDAYSDCSLQVADADGTHVVEFGYGGSGPWNPLVQPELPVAESPVASEDPLLLSTLLLAAALLALITRAVLIRHRMSGSARNVATKPPSAP